MAMTLRSMRLECGLTQREVAEQMGVQRPAVSKIERKADMSIKPGHGARGGARPPLTHQGLVRGRAGVLGWASALDRWQMRDGRPRITPVPLPFLQVSNKRKERRPAVALRFAFRLEGLLPL